MVALGAPDGGVICTVVHIQKVREEEERALLIPAARAVTAIPPMVGGVETGAEGGGGGGVVTLEKLVTFKALAVVGAQAKLLAVAVAVADVGVLADQAVQETPEARLTLPLLIALM